MSTSLSKWKQAQRLIRKPAAWCKGALHRDGARCSLGATVDAGLWTTFPLNLAVCLMTGGTGIAAFNDAETTTHADVMEAFEIAKELVPMVEASV